MENMKFIPCVCWIKKGIAKANPEKVAVSKEELQQVIEENKTQLQSLNADDELSNCSDNENQNQTRFAGSRSDQEIIADYNLDSYDNDEKPVDVLAGLSSLVVYSSNDDDPYIDLKDEDDDSECNDYVIKPSDNLIAVGHVDDDCNILEVQVYNNFDGNYVHHDIILPSFPLCVEWMDFDPTENEKSNFMAIGYMNSLIEVWDIDLVDSLEPEFTLGNKLKKKKKQKASSGHTDAVLDLSWNKHVRHVLASGSADNTVALWDMSKGKIVTSITAFTDKVQTIEWHPYEAETILTGSYDGSVKIFDCRNINETSIEWTLDGQIERVKWNPFNPFYCLASTDKGFVHYLDSRSSKPVWSISAHFDACTGISLSSQCDGLLVTSSLDKSMKIWDIKDSKPQFVAEKNVNLGKIFCLECCPDDGFVFAVGGDNRSNNFTVQNLRDISLVSNHFANRQLMIPKSSSSINNVPGLEKMDITEITSDEMSSANSESRLT